MKTSLAGSTMNSQWRGLVKSSVAEVPSRHGLLEKKYLSESGGRI